MSFSPKFISSNYITLIAFDPVGDIPNIFRQLKSDPPESMIEFMEYFDVTYVNGVQSSLVIRG